MTHLEAHRRYGEPPIARVFVILSPVNMESFATARRETIGLVTRPHHVPADNLVIEVPHGDITHHGESRLCLTRAFRKATSTSSDTTSDKTSQCDR